MKQSNLTRLTYFHSIGQTDTLQPISASATPNKTVHYSSPSHHLPISSHPNPKYIQPSISSPQKYLHHSSKKHQFKQKQTHHSQHSPPAYFWPTDLINDKSGNILKNFKSYLQTHRVNSYIKLQLSSKENISLFLFRILQKLIKKYQLQYFQFIKYHLLKSDKIIQKSKSLNLLINSKKNSYTKIDYEIITISKNKHPKRKSKIIYYTPSSTIINGEQQFFLTKQIQIDDARKFSKYPTRRKNTPNKNLQNISKQTAKIKYKPLSIHQKRYLTPNTSTYLGNKPSQDNHQQPDQLPTSKLKSNQNRYSNYHSSKTSRSHSKAKNPNQVISSNIAINQHVQSNQISHSKHSYLYDSNNQQQNQNIYRTKNRIQRNDKTSSTNILTNNDQQLINKNNSKISSTVNTPQQNGKHRTLITLSNNA